MIDLLQRLRFILSSRDVRKSVWLLAAFMIMGVLEVSGIASIMPFMQLAAQPDAISESELLNRVYTIFGFQNEKTFVFAAGVFVLVLMTTANAATVIVAWLQQKYVWGIARRLARRLMETYIYQPYEFFLGSNSSVLGKQVLDEVNRLANQVLLPLVQLVARSFVSLVIFALLVAVEPLLAAIVFSVLGLVYTGLYLLIAKYLKKLGKERFESNQQRFKTAHEALGSIKIVKIASAESYFVKRFMAAVKRHTRIAPKFSVASSIPVYFVQTLAFGGLLAIVLYLLSAEESIQKVVPILSLYALAAYRLLPSLRQIFISFSRLPFSVPIVEAIDHDLRLDKSAKYPAPKDGFKDLEFENEINVNDVTFSYFGSVKPVLRNINVKIPKNSSVAFVGPTGSGKTTLVDVIAGLLRPSSGSVFVDEAQLDDRNTRSWQSTIGYVPQDVTLYDDTVTRNIVFGLEAGDIDRAKVQRVAEIANIHEDIERELPNGYETKVGERGIRLSGGQRQRLGLARALYGRPTVLVLDEATNALDGITERAVMQAINRIGYGITTIIIAHRLTTVENCDYIYLIDEGQIVAEGTYDQLIEENSMFRELAKVNE